MEILQIHNLSKSFGNVHAVDNVSLRLRRGDIAAVIGPNGAGKTTLVNLVTGLIKPDSGKIIFNGIDITYWEPQHRVRVGIVRTFQIPNLFNGLTVLENVRICTQYSLGKKRTSCLSSIESESIRLAKHILSEVGLADQAEKRACELSCGDRKKLELAMGLALKPTLLILDEPTAGLSPEETKHMIMFMQDEIVQKTTIMFIEHKMDVVMSLARRVYVMHNGRLIAEGTSEEIKNNKLVQEVYLGSKFIGR